MSANLNVASPSLVKGKTWTGFATSEEKDGLLVTGQQRYSGAAAARLVIEALGR